VAHNKDEASLLLVKAIIERSLAVEEVLKIRSLRGQRRWVWR
jgi:hypothetical protein